MSRKLTKIWCLGKQINFFCWKKILLILGLFFALQLLQYKWALIAELVLVRQRHGGPPHAY